MPKAKPAKKAAPAKADTAKEPPTITKDGLFISRKMRRDADAVAKAESELKKRDADDAADDIDLNTYLAKYQGQTDAEKAFNAEKAQLQATAEARKKYGLV